ncbi:nucleotide-diphospho-sugar transferase [Linderina pennispora]|uniref:Nucleotide-diphospho-sugar transferase n=1 Tax=Linderina pennispora TaxID=61395 RepID=A0A1Y1W6E5_9FUNG|nr:nucleotide-diphospho-sugar transferase [Linderina pennispora]ORX69113.1 nucleotide-diphospho-sugar transferase [Linderina pennispora]
MINPRLVRMVVLALGLTVMLVGFRSTPEIMKQHGPWSGADNWAKVTDRTAEPPPAPTGNSTARRQRACCVPALVALDFTDEFKRKVKAITTAPVYFGKVPSSHWGLSPYVEEQKVKEALEYNKDRYLYGGSFSYREMCRYQSGFIYKHPLLANLDYYWRIEPDVSYFCDLTKVYGFTITPMEKRLTVETLWNTTRQWMIENERLLPEKSLIHWVVNEKAKYTLCHFWSNFEIVDLSFYRSEAYESPAGSSTERWGDAPVHSFAASMLLRKEQMHWFEDIGYAHPGYTHCPNKAELAQRCVCDENDELHVSNIWKDQALRLAQNILD